MSPQGVGDSSGLTFSPAASGSGLRGLGSGKGSGTLAFTRRLAAQPEFPAEEKGA